MRDHGNTEFTYKDIFFSTQPYRNKDELYTVLGFNILGAIIAPIAIAVMEPVIILGLAASLLVSFVSALSYEYHRQTNQMQYLQDNADSYDQLRLVTLAFLVLTIVPSPFFSFALLANAIHRGSLPYSDNHTQNQNPVNYSR
jgi:surface polysaccharide O-acyltransferase-like enzyme